MLLLASMYMGKLLIVIVSLNFVECYSNKSEIRFGYGSLYEHRGQLFHGLNKYHLLVGVDTPQFTFTQYSYQREQQFVNMTILHGVCYSLMAFCIIIEPKNKEYL